MDIQSIPAADRVELSNQSKEEVLQQFATPDIPFEVKFCFQPLVQHIQSLKDSEDQAEAFLVNHILTRLEEAPELAQPIEDMSIIERYNDIAELFMLFLFPPALRDKMMAKVMKPYGLKPLYETPLLHKLWHQNRMKYTIDTSTNVFKFNRTIPACVAILNEFYGQEIDLEPPIFVMVEHEDCKLPKHYRIQLNNDFVAIKKLKPLKPLSQEQINHLLSNIYDTDLWLQYIPPENFAFHGMVIGYMSDITEVESLSRIKFSLLERDAVTKPDKVKMLEDLVGAYLKLPNLRLGITAIDYPTEKMIAHKYKIRFDFLAAHQEQLLTQANSNSIYEKACRYGEVLLVEDIEELVNKTPIEEGLLKQGIRSILVAPLFNQEKQVIGLLEIGSPRPYAIHSFVELQFKQLTGLFSIAVERSRDEIDNRIEATIREQYTAVHPSVEWKFIETTYNLIEQRAKDPELAVADPIIFNDVYPLYGQADIVSSSSKRNRAILADLIDNLERVEVILEFAQKRLRFPLVNQYLYKIRTNIEGLKAEFNSNDESRIVEMLQDEIHPLLRELRMQHQDLSGPVTSYFNYLDEELQIVYRERKRYEDSVSKINSVIANYLETQQKEAQKILPHYFEKYKTDGVEYNMYVGQSLLNKHHFDLMHLQNLRLWQLIDMCNITRKVEHMKDSLEVPLTTAQLIFAYSTPLSIRFRMDEKQFDVDGAYNVRYEILKKRIDKARVADTDERLTVAGKVAIVYLNEKDKQEYMGYFDYLIAEGYIEEEVEDLTLGKLQGVQGLRALRVTVREGKE